ncbi:hypothetical protein HPB50_003832 [Hyalomma asiaticum]|uniref:Uncharacterized protein n=1 Tax=Hyalomma asiaticum TaxID=266040 RepID=A0ACB7TGN2_HYAAI|nr:hypothetical protein HPB50_003832 [Hyalomma asiaticum]
MAALARATCASRCQGELALPFKLARCLQSEKRWRTCSGPSAESVRPIARRGSSPRRPEPGVPTLSPALPLPRRGSSGTRALPRARETMSMGLAAPPRPTSAGQRPGLPSSRRALSLAPARCLRESRWAAAAEVGRGAAAIQLPSGREQLPTSATGFLAAALDRLACRPRTCAAETGPGSNASELQSTWCKDSYKPSPPSRPTKERLQYTY